MSNSPVTDTGRGEPLRVVFVCWGNICRSPMTERVADGRAAEAGLGDVEFTSAGVSTEELGNPMDDRATAKLGEAGYDADGHVAHQIDAAEIDSADLVVAMEQLHLDRMLAMGPRRTDHLKLLTSFDPDAEPGAGVPDPWYGDADGFADTLASIEAAMPGILDDVAALRGRR